MWQQREQGPASDKNRRESCLKEAGLTQTQSAKNNFKLV